ncbi:MAG TPA: hypothetical protein VH186_12540 [Chloroflexia bacterium]|nr:hypothetical protein [Chloroflexia bacterium]
MSDSKLPGAKGAKWRVTVVKAQNKVAAEQVSDAFNRQLAEVLRGRDVFRFRNFLASSGRALPDEMMLDVYKMETLMHQLTLSFAELSDLHASSREWLEQNTLLQNRSGLNAAANRPPGEPYAQPAIPPPPPGKRIITLRTVSSPPKPEHN